MPESSSGFFNVLGVLGVLVLVAANGFFVAAEFSMVAVRRSRVAELVAAGRMNAGALQRALGNLDANLAATQLGITISSLALGWIGEPALAHLIEPLLSFVPASFTAATSHVIAVAIAFIVITALHIVLGELAPKSLALQRSESTALWVVRPLGFFLFLLKPAILILNGLGNLILRLVGLRAGTGEESLHSPDELKLLITASYEAGLLQEAQQEVAERVFSIGDRHISDIMTPRPEIDWVNAKDDLDEILKRIRQCPHEQMLVGRRTIDEPIGVISKHEVLDRMLDGKTLDLAAIMHDPLVIPEVTPIFSVLSHFKKGPVRLAMIVDEYGSLQGIVTQTDLLEAIAGDLPEAEGEQPQIVERDDGSFLVDGLTPIREVFIRLGLDILPAQNDFHTVAGFALYQLGRIPAAGEKFKYRDWKFEVVDMDKRRIDKLLISRKQKRKAAEGAARPKGNRK
ncbi:hemolysin family protein [Taklimakanibacter lacteus]|uniref:hemolysin family protein n=1 Tax=Taklimakanibacter lacteus TaxID=2268456 RepID=UPI000E67348B